MIPSSFNGTQPSIEAKSVGHALQITPSHDFTCLRDNLGISTAAYFNKFVIQIFWYLFFKISNEKRLRKQILFKSEN